MTDRRCLRAANLGTLSTDSMPVGRLALNTSAKVRLKVQTIVLEDMRQSQEQAELGLFLKHIQVSVIVRKDMVAVREADEVRLDRLANKMRRNMCSNYMFVDLMKTGLNCAIAFDEG